MEDQMKLFTVRVSIEFMKNKKDYSFLLDSNAFGNLFVVRALDASAEFKIALDRQKMVEGIREALVHGDYNDDAVNAIRAGNKFDFVPRAARNMDWAATAVKITQFYVDVCAKPLLEQMINDHADNFYTTTYSRIGQLEIDIVDLEAQTPKDIAARGRRLYSLTRKRKMLEELLNFKQYTPSTEATSGVWSFWDFEKDIGLDD